MIDKAIIFATNVHKGEKRKGKDMPYIFHPLEAAMIVSHMSTDENLIIAAILHDTIEDTDVTYEEIAREFGEKVAKFVEKETEDKSKSWMERKEHTLKRLEKETLEVKIIAMGDKLSNMRAIARDYNKQGDKLWERFNVKDKEKQSWYYKGIKKSLKELENYPEYKEYVQLCDKVFG